MPVNPNPNPDSMKATQRFLTSFLPLAACAALLLGVSANAADEKKADVAGTWTWTSPGRNGGAERKNTLKLKVEGEQVTGTLSSVAGDGGKGGGEAAITDAKVKGDEISFSSTREFNGTKFTQKYTGKISGDSIKGKIESERDGKAQSRDWEAKRAK
jgi:hypothetical protein